MIPLRDINPTRRTPFVTYLLIFINIGVFFWELTFSPVQRLDLFMERAVVPLYITQNPVSLEALLDALSSMFFHGDWLHLGGNMLYLYLFGDNVEDRFGGPLYLLLYFAGGFAAVAAQVWIEPLSRVPLVGASGAIAAVLGSYLVLFPGVRVRGIIPLGFFAWFAEWPAIIVLALWFMLQLLSSLMSLGVPTGEEAGGVAFFAHMGGFVFGIVLTALFTSVLPQPPAEDRRRMLYDRVRYWDD